MISVDGGMARRESDYSRPTVRRRGMRTGYTTGACAAAAAKAATLALLTGEPQQSVSIGLPIGKDAEFQISRCEIDAPDGAVRSATCAVVKDGGDDPDVTSGAEIVAKVWMDDAAPDDAPDAVSDDAPSDDVVDGMAGDAIDGAAGGGTDRAAGGKANSGANGGDYRISLCGGEGVGTVTKPGTGIAVGDPSITRVPRRMITQAVRDAVDGVQTASVGGANGVDADNGIVDNGSTDGGANGVDTNIGGASADTTFIVEISVPGGREIAKKTDNPRLGIVDGISILGTTGVVQPFSTAAWRASVNVSIDVAAANDLAHMVISTGTQSELFAKRRLALPDMSYVNVGIFTGAALKRCVQRGIPRATLVGMVGKFSKIAMGYFVTHVAGNKVDPVFLASLAAECGASDDVQEQMRAAASGRHFQEIALEYDMMSVFDLMCERVCDEAQRYLADRADALIVDAICFDFEGGILGKASTSAAGIPLVSAGASYVVASAASTDMAAADANTAADMAADKTAAADE